MATGVSFDKLASDDKTEEATDCFASNKENEKISPIVRCGRYENPWITWPANNISLKNLFKFRWQRQRSSLPQVEELDRTLPVLKPDFTEFSTSSSDIRCVWIGHASVLVQFDGVTILTDPVFSSHCSPFPFVGPRRFRGPPCSVDDLPVLDAVIISHNHYDHLDVCSVRDLNRRFGKQLRWYVPMGLKKWMLDAGCENCVEMIWWDEDLLSEKMGVKLACLPCQHWSGRSPIDANKTLWCSWAVVGPKKRFYFAGDTGYCDCFTQIGKHYGPFSLAAIPIGNYKPSWFLSPQHVSPAEAVRIHHEVCSQTSIGIHWGTFSMMSYEELDRTLPVLKPDLSEFSTSSSDIRCVWIGHASVLVQFDGVTILTDPVFSSHCSPFPFVGPRRFRGPPCSVDDLPVLDAVHQACLDLHYLEPKQDLEAAVESSDMRGTSFICLKHGELRTFVS